jgi:hypothetical protein
LALAGPLAARDAPEHPAAPPAAALKPDSGSVSAGIYRNDFFGFSYSFPADWKVQSEKEQRAIAERGHQEAYDQDPNDSAEHQQAMKYTWFLLGAGASAADPQKPSLQLIAFDLAGDRSFKNPRQFLGQLSAPIKAMGGRVTQAPTEKTIAGHRFTSVQYRIDTLGDDNRPATVYWESALTVERGHVLAWFFFSDSQAALDRLAGTLDSIAFVARR